MINAIGDCQRSDIPSQLERLKELGGDVDDVDCFPLQPFESVVSYCADRLKDENSTKRTGDPVTNARARRTESPCLVI